MLCSMWEAAIQLDGDELRTYLVDGCSEVIISILVKHYGDLSLEIPFCRVEG